MARPEQAHNDGTRKLLVLGAMTLLIAAGIVGTMFAPGGAGSGSGSDVAAGSGSDPFAEVGDDGKKEPPAKKQVPFPDEALSSVEDDTLLDDEKEPGHDLLRAWLMSKDAAWIRTQATRPPTPQEFRKQAKQLRQQEKIYLLRGKVLHTRLFPMPDRKSDVTVVYRGEIDVDGKIYAFEALENRHGVDKGERAVLRGAFYKMGSLEDNDGTPLDPRPLIVAAQFEPDYDSFIRQIKDGANIRRKGPYWYLVRKVRSDPPNIVAATTVTPPSDEALKDLATRDSTRGKYFALEGKVTWIKRRGLNANNNRAFLDEIWEGALTDDSGRIWHFDVISKPAYEQFLLAHRVRLVGAFALMHKWKDDKGVERQSAHLVAKDLSIAVDKGGQVPFVEIPSILEATKDDTKSRTVDFFYLLHKLSTQTQEQLDAQTDAEFNLHKIVTKQKRKEMRGKMIRISGRLLRVEAFTLPERLRVNPSGITKMWRVYVVTGTRTIYTVDMIEPPTKKARPMRSEVNINAAFWQVHTFKNKDDKLEKSPWLLARSLTKRTPYKPPSGLRSIAFGAMTLICAVLLFLMYLGRREAGAAESVRRERSRKRILASAAARDGVPTPDSAIIEADKRPAPAEAAPSAEDPPPAEDAPPAEPPADGAPAGDDTP